MYHHGFSLLALAEAYGAVDDSLLWESNSNKKRPVPLVLLWSWRCDAP